MDNCQPDPTITAEHACANSIASSRSRVFIRDLICENAPLYCEYIDMTCDMNR
jgi:hypothetical protein